LTLPLFAHGLAEGPGAVLSVTSTTALDPGCGKVIPPPTDPWLVPPNLALARFAP
jgi:hypothetical protein